jgi:hypothetical protein
MENRDPDHERIPDDLRDTADMLRAQRPDVSPLELDRIKQRARAQAARGVSTEARLGRPRRALPTVVTALALMVGLGGAFAIAGGGPPSGVGGNGSAADSQYRPGKGCGDKNHEHEREDECKKPPR